MGTKAAVKKAKAVPAQWTASKGQHVGYIRVSSVGQNTVRQLDGVQLDKTFTDKCSGRTAVRPALQACLEHLREGDWLHVHGMDRLARNLEDMLRLVRELTGRGVSVHFQKENLTFSGDSAPMNQLMLALLGSFAEFERSIIRERQREGIEKAKERGVYMGRKPKLTATKVIELRRRAKDEEKTALAREFGISRQTLYEYLKQ